MSLWLSEKAEEIFKIWRNTESIPIKKITDLGLRVKNTFDSGGRLAFAGNGGSAAESSHLAAEFTGKCVLDHEPWPALSLSESSPAVTAIGNDYGFDEILVRQSRAFLNSTSIIIAMTTSGTSKNVIELLKDAHSRGIYTVVWTSRRWITAEVEPNEVWKAHSHSTPRAQEMHLVWGHLLAEYVELLSYGKS